MILRRAVVCAFAAGLFAGGVAAAERSLPTVGESLVLNEDEPGICAAMAAGLARHAVQAFDPDRDPAAAGLVFMQAPIAPVEALDCGTDAVKDLLACIVTGYARQRRALLAEDVTLAEARRGVVARGRYCAADIPYTR